MAAHLERVAREFADLAKLWDSRGQLYESKAYESMQDTLPTPGTVALQCARELEVVAGKVAAALAACAREARIEAIKDTIRAFENEYCNHEQPLIGVARGARAMCELKFEVERAAGESK